MDKYKNDYFIKSMKFLKEFNEIFDSVYPSQINLKSFENKDILNPKIWTDNELKPLIRKQLKTIAVDFINNTEIKGVTIHDIVLVGSITGFNWSKFSDIDLHIILDFDKLSKKYGDKETLKKLFDRERQAFNNKHNNLYIYGYPVEMYVQDINEENVSNGIYSIMQNRWIKIPEGGNTLTNRDLIKTKSAQFINIIDKYEEITKRNLSKNQLIILQYRLESLFDEIIQGRRTSLAEEGELAPDNIVFKVLRRSGHLGKLNDMKTLVYDRINSVKTRVNESFINELSGLNTDNFYKINKNNESEEIFKDHEQLKFMSHDSEKQNMLILGEYVPLHMNVIVFIKEYSEIYVARVSRTSLINIREEKILNEISEAIGLDYGHGKASEEIQNVFIERKPAKDFADMVNKRFASKLPYNVFCKSSINESFIYESQKREFYTLSAVNVEDDSPVNEMKYTGKYHSEQEAKKAATEWADALKEISEDVICVSVMTGQYEESGNIIGDAYDIWTISTQDKEKTMNARKKSGYVRQDVDEYLS